MLKLNLKICSNYKIVLIIVGLFFLSINPSGVNAGTIEDLAVQADNAYRDGDFEKSITIYQQILNSGYSSGNILFNLGNACFKAGRLGESILYYERALNVMPQSKDVRYNLKLARSHTVDRIEYPPRLPLWDWLDSLRDTIAPGILAWGSWMIAMLAAIIFGISLFINNWRLSKIMKISSLVSSSVFLFLLGLFILRIVEDNAPPSAIIMQDKVIVYSAPDLSSKEVFHLHEGTSVTIIKELEGFREIQLVDGRQGWLPANSCEEV